MAVGFDEVMRGGISSEVRVIEVGAQEIGELFLFAEFVRVSTSGLDGPAVEFGSAWR